MGVKVFKNEQGGLMVQGIPSGYWVFVAFGILIIMIGLMGTFGGSFIGGFVITTIGVIILLCGKRYGNSKRQKKVNEFYNNEKQQTEEQKEFEEFKRWKSQNEM